uniref:Nucleotidyl transferase AbiEii/AbiGii toxin family protein n=1 Tax=Ignavibacterium album TaxID=591197 RepID=A0A832DKH2_9BACT
MIKKECFSKEWIDQKRSIYTASDPIILERSIYAFELLGKLKKESVEFIFKGGTSLILLLDEPKRLSIDVDIVTSEVEDKISKALDEILKNGIFNRWEEDPRTDKGIPKKHYKVYYDSVVNNKFPAYVLLDVLFADNPYPATLEKIIASSLFEVDEDISITTPTINGILGDKLTAFAPKTTGIPFGIGKDMQINKQLFDIGILFEKADDLEEIKNAFDECVKIEAGYRGIEISPEDVIRDLIEISFLISQMNLRNSVSNAITREFQDGVRKIRSHLLAGNYTIDDAKINPSRCALLVTLIGKEVNFNEIKLYNADKIDETELKGDRVILNRLRSISPEAFYYWQHIEKNQ